MDRRDFLARASAFLGAFGVYPVAIAAAAEKSRENNKKIAKAKQSVLPFVPGSWTLAVLPDTQKYSQSYPGLLRLQTQWILENKDKHNIAYVLQLGDVTQHNIPLEWERASRAFEILDAAVPYAIVPGNHDYDYDKARGKGMRRESTRINDYFPPSRFQKQSTFGGTMEKGRIENNYHLFAAGGRKWIVIGLEWGPRDATLQWAGRLLHEHADHKAIVFTHAYLDSDSKRLDWRNKEKSINHNPHDPDYNTSGGVNDGEEIWQKLIKNHDNVCMVISGHIGGDGLGFQVGKTESGNTVNEIAVNYQRREIGGAGLLRLIEFLPDGRTVQARTYSPFYERYETDAENQFIMKMD